MSRRTRRGGGFRPAPQPKVIPVKGALVEEGEGVDSLALKMIIEQMNSAQEQNMLMLQAMQAALTAQTDAVKQLQLELMEVKRDAATSLEETRVRIQKLMEQRPTDPQTLREQVKAANIRAKQEMLEAEARFTQALETMPRGEIDARDMPYTGEAIKLIINGHARNIIPGKINKDVPQAFIDHWEKRKSEKAWAEGLDAAFKLKDAEGDFMGANYYQQLLAQPGFTFGG